jgi:hypothetical protein
VRVDTQTTSGNLQLSHDKSIRNELLSLIKVVCEPLFGVYFPNRGFQLEADYIIRVNMIASKVIKEIFKSRSYIIKPGTLSQLQLFSLTDIENEIKSVHRSRTSNSVQICSKVLNKPMKEGYDFIIHYHYNIKINIFLGVTKLIAGNVMRL